MIKVVVIEDEISVQKDILGIIRLSGIAEVVGIGSTVKEALQILSSIDADVALLDIRLEDGSAFDIISRLHAPRLNIIFITAYEEYAINAIKAGALDYLIKPLDLAELKLALCKVNFDIPLQKQIDIAIEANNRRPNKIVLKNTEGIHFISFDELLYCKGEGSYTRFYTEDEKSVMVSKSIKEYEKLLPSNIFVRCHQSYAANKSFIRKINKDGFLELKNGTLIPVSERKKEQVIKELTQ